MKSAYELAMERLEAENPDAGKSLTEEQKAEIAKINQECEAKIAEAKILKEGEMAKAGQEGRYERVQELEGQLRIDIRRAEEDREAKKAKIRGK